MSSTQSAEYVITSGKTVTIRTAQANDAAAILKIRVDTIQEGACTLAEPVEFSVTEEQQRAEILDHEKGEGMLYLVAEIGGKIVGYLQFVNGKNRRVRHTGMLSIYLERDSRAKGIGTLLIEALLRWAESHPFVEKVTLATFANNVRAISVYEKCGFTVEGRLPKDIKLADGSYVDSVLMFKFVKG